MSFVNFCGESRAKQNKIIYSPKFRYAPALVAVMLIGGFGSYFYFSGVNEEKYLTNCTAAARDIGTVNGNVVGNIKLDTLKSTKPETLAEQLKTQKNILDAQAKIFSEPVPFNSYERRHADAIALLQTESNIVDQIIQVVSNPLDANVETLIDSIKNNIAAAETLEDQINVPNANLAANANLSGVPEQLSLFVAEQKKIHAEKSEKLAANQKFFSADGRHHPPL